MNDFIFIFIMILLGILTGELFIIIKKFLKNRELKKPVKYSGTNQNIIINDIKLREFIRKDKNILIFCHQIQSIDFDKNKIFISFNNNENDRIFNIDINDYWALKGFLNNKDILLSIECKEVK